MRPTPEDIAAAKAAALKLSTRGSDEVLDIEIDDAVTGFVGTVLAAPMGLATWKEHTDLAQRSEQLADSTLFAALVLWPAFDPAQAKRGELASMQAHVRSELLEQAGYSVERVALAKLGPGNRPAWLSVDDAAKLAAENKTLFVATFPQGLGAIMKPPSTEVFHAARAAEQRAHGEKAGIVDATLSYSKALVLRSSEPLDQVLEREPCITTDLKQALFLMGGSAAKVRSKRI